MQFSPADKMYLLNRLPALELSYEPKLHKKVYASAYYVIPKGPKALVWYTYWKDRNVCLLIKLNERGNYSDVQVFPTTFSDALAWGTIIYGTYFLHYNQHYFTCEQLHYYKGNAVAKKPFTERLNLLLDMFTTHVDQVMYTTTTLVVGMPVLTETYEEALGQLDTLPYKTYGIGAYGIGIGNAYASAYASGNASASGNAYAYASKIPAIKYDAKAAKANVNTFANNAPAKAIFKVKADVAADNYQLYTAEDTLYETAMVPTYKASVMLNTLFRTIKENANLDLLEESDDEEEFENGQQYVDLEKTVVMECIYSKRFKQWQPLREIGVPHPKIITLKELQHFFKK